MELLVEAKYMAYLEALGTVEGELGIASFLVNYF
jgi:hypothetical protein